MTKAMEFTDYLAVMDKRQKGVPAMASAPRTSNHPQQAEALAAGPFAVGVFLECWHCRHHALQAKQHGPIIDKGGLSF